MTRARDVSKIFTTPPTVYYTDDEALNNLMRYRFVATGGETTISGVDANGSTLSYVAGIEKVYLNGALLVRGYDYIATNGTSITSLSPALVNNDVIEIFSFNTFNVANTYTQSQVDGFVSSLGGTNTAWTSYTPTWTNLTVGNGTNNFAYKQIGKSIFVRGEFSFGSTSSITGGVSFTLPVTSIAYSGEFSFGNVSLGDSGTADYFGAIYYAASSKGVIRIINAAGTYATFAGISSTVPFTWTTGDSMKFHLFYEAA